MQLFIRVKFRVSLEKQYRLSYCVRNIEGVINEFVRILIKEKEKLMSFTRGTSRVASHHVQVNRERVSAVDTSKEQ